MGPDPLVDVAAELYALPPEEFIAARDEAVKRARLSGDRRLAAAIGKLRRPTLGAWLVNQLARERPEMIDELLALGEALRDAQRNLRGGDLRDLTVRRRETVSRLTAEAVALGRRAYRRTILPLNEIEATLTAALADPEVAEQVRAGLLARTVEHTGFGETPRPQLRLVRGGGSDTGADQDGAVGRSPAGKRVLRAATPEPVVDAGQRAVTGAERAAAERAEAERAAAERAEAERAEAERAEAERAEAERAEAERVEAQRAEAERVAAERRAAEKAEREAERVKVSALRQARVAAQRELLAARTELAEAEAARVAAERAAKAAKRRVEKAVAALNALEPEV
jgi:DNA repair exonuclease SbcCD ATPase subunit